MPSGRELSRLKSQNKELREAVEVLEGRVRSLLKENEDYRNCHLADMILHEDSGRELHDAQGEIETLRAQVAKVRKLDAHVQAEIAADLERVRLALDEAREDVKALETRVEERLKLVEERGKRKDREAVAALGNRAVLGCRKSMKVIEEAAARHQARMAKAGVADDEGAKIVAFTEDLPAVRALPTGAFPVVVLQRDKDPERTDDFEAVLVDDDCDESIEIPSSIESLLDVTAVNVHPADDPDYGIGGE
jgi:chromosome segregation ATPase